MRVVLITEPDECAVWVTLEGHGPIRDPFGFCIGVGPTPEAAIAHAKDDLHGALAALEQSHDADPDDVARAEAEGMVEGGYGHGV